MANICKNPIIPIRSSRSRKNEFYRNAINPMIKLNFEGMLLFANSTGIDFLELILKSFKEPAVNYLIKKAPQILDRKCDMELVFTVNDKIYYFNVVAFNEGGYVGLYGYNILTMIG